MARKRGGKLRFGCREIEALLRAVARGEEIKPFQVAKREVFQQFGIVGTDYDRVFTAIIYKFFRARGLVDKIVAKVTNLDPEKIEDLLTRTALRLGTYLRVLDEVKDENLLEAFHRCVRELIDPSYRQLFDAVWRALEGFEYVPSTRDEELELRYLVPSYLVKLLRQVVENEKELEELLNALNTPLPLGFRVNTLKSSIDRVVRKLRRLGVDAWPSERVPNHVRYMGGVDYTKLDLLRNGEVVPQDEPSALAAILLDPRPGELIVDLCAAPGGKTTHLAELSRNRATIIAFDIFIDRMERLKEMAMRTGTYQSILPMLADARYASRILGEEVANKVLLDPPCSSTGVLFKHPDARWKLTPERLLDTVMLQRALLEEAHRILKPGGKLLYTTCSLLYAENEGNIKWFLSKHPCYEIVPLKGPYEESRFLPGAMRAWPHRHGVSGFFYVLLEKVYRC